VLEGLLILRLPITAPDGRSDSEDFSGMVKNSLAQV